MSAPNTRASKIERLLKRVSDIDVSMKARHELEATIKTLSTTNQMLTATAQSLEADNSRLRKYLGSVLFQRRQAQVAKAFIADPKWTPVTGMPGLSFTITGPLVPHMHPYVAPLSQHTFDDKGRRCTRCHCLKAALEASGEGCVTGAPL